MPTVTCPNYQCGKSYQVSEESQGGRARCKSCGSVFELNWGGDQSDAANRSSDDVNRKSTGSTHSEAAQLNDTQADFPKTLGQSQIPETLGRFEIKSVLGAGTFGTVYHGHDPQLDREVALKVPNVGVLRTEEEAERFLREARAAASLRHPNICPVYEANEQDGRYCIVMAFISGKTLSSLITPDKPLSERQIVSLVQKLAQALDLAHKKGVVHRDLKPGNIMFDQEHREPVIMDFGLARRSSDSQMTQEGQILGTPAYMSPEQALGDINAIGPASDVYSLGVIFYELLCGQRPFPGFPEQVRAAHYLKTEADPPSTHRSGINPTLEAICLKAMSREIEDRLSMAELAEALSHYVSGIQPAPDVLSPVQISKDRSSETSAASKEAGLSALYAAVAVNDEMPAAIKSMNVKPRKRPATRSDFRRSLPPGIKWVAGTGAAALLILLGVVLFIQTDAGLVKIEILSDDLEVTFQNETIKLADGAQEYKIKPGDYTLHIKSGNAEFDTDKFTLTKGNNPAVTVELVQDKIVAKAGDKQIARHAVPTTPADPDTSTTNIPSDAKSFGDHSYKFFGDQLAWKDAKAKCEALGGNLVIIDSAEENKFVADLVGAAAWQDAWIGVTDEAQEGNWLTVTGQPIAFTNWFTGQPNDKGGGEDFALMSNQRAAGQILAWRWCDQANRAQALHQPGFVCEWNLPRADGVPSSGLKSEQNASWVPLFNDTGLAGWDELRSASITWTNENGTIIGRNRSNRLNTAGSLSTQAEYKNFHFRCEVLAGPPAAGMIFFRHTNSLIKGARRGYSVLNTDANSPLTTEGWGIGSLYADDFQVPPHNSRLANTTETDLGIKPGDWYVLEILAQDEAIEIRVNGKKTTDYRSHNPALDKAGSLVIRCGQGATVTYRNLEIKELK